MYVSTGVWENNQQQQAHKQTNPTMAKTPVTKKTTKMTHINKHNNKQNNMTKMKRKEYIFKKKWQENKKTSNQCGQWQLDWQPTAAFMNGHFYGN